MKIKVISLLLISFFCFNSENASAQNFDINLLKSININRNKELDPFFKATSNSVYPIMAIAPSAFFVHGLIKKDSLTLQDGIEIGVSIALTVAVSAGLKYAINRPRPYIEYPNIDNIATENSPSFPSGHTSTAFSVATSVSLCYPKWYVIAPMYLWAGSVGYSRMHLGVHYPSDVFVGAIIGSGCAYLSCKANQWIRKRSPKR
jgi:membrane-associated phospholipid phosphatase